MELNLQRQTITVNEVVYDGSVEQPVECDALLPDYCPDIVKVLKCAVTTNVTSTTVNGDRLTIEGISAAHVYYSSETGSIRHTEYKIPFGKGVDLRSAPANPVITVSPGVDYVNCRAVNQRRIDIRGALSLSVKITDQKEEGVVSDAEGAGLQLRRDMVSATDLIGQHETTFAIEEDLELGYGKAPVGNIVRTDCRANVMDYKVIAGKVVAKGEFMLHVCYQPADENSGLEIMEYSLPISQIIDSEGADEECVCDVEMYVVSCDLQPKADEAGEYRTLSLDARVKAVVAAHRHMEIPVASDCYSTLYECKCQHKPVSFLKLEQVVREMVMHKATLDLPEGVAGVLDAWCEVEQVNWRYEMGSLKVSVGLTVSMFAQMDDGQAMYFEQPTELEHAVGLDAQGESVVFDPTCDVLSSAYNLLGKEKIDIRCEVMVKGCVYSSVKQNSIGDITVDSEAPKSKEQNKLYLYYAEAGESIWDIAKRYNTSANAIWDENSVEDDILPGKCMLLIPIV